MPAHTVTQRLEYEQSADGLFRGALRAHEHPGARAALREAGLDLERLAPAYPADQFYRWVGVATRQLFPELDERAGYKKAGMLAVERGLRSTLIGNAVLQVLKVIGVRRSLLRIGRTFRSGNNYIDAKVTEVGPTTLEIELGPLMGPTAYFEGVLEEGPRQLGAKTVRVGEAGRTGEHVTFRLDWTE
jgi:uncharacterized protein (TIGR02265 family)